MRSLKEKKKHDAWNQFGKPFSVLLIKLMFETAYFSAVYFAAEEIMKLQNNFVFAAAVFVFVLIRFLIFLPLYFGTVLFFCYKVFFCVSRVKSLFCFFSPKFFWAAVKNGFVLLVYRLLCLTVFWLPGLSMLVLMCYNIVNSSSVLLFLLSLLAFLMLAVSGALAFSKATKLAFLFAYIFVLSPEQKTSAILNESIRLMKGKTVSVTAVKFGNFFRILLCTLIFPIGFVWNSCQQRKAGLAKKILLGQTQTD